MTRFHVFRDSSGVHLVVVDEGDISREFLRPAYLVRPGEPPRGPREAGVWLKFCPSDYAPVAAPYPEAVQTLLDRL